MKKMLSLAAMFAVLSYASPASAELKISGDAAVRERGQWNNKTTDKDLKTQYRVRLNTAADLGSGYFFKAMIQNEGVADGWQTVAANNSERNPLEVSNFYFGRMLEDCHYMLGRIPLNSANNPIYDITLYPVPTAFTSAGIYAVDIPVNTNNFDRVFGINYGTKVGGGELNATVCIFDNNSVTENTTATGDGLFNDGYALNLAYKTTLGDVTFEPQAIISLTDVRGVTYQKVSPNTAGANVTIPAGKSKIGLSGFYTICRDTKGESNLVATNVDYDGYLLRAKGESGPVKAWVDYNRTKDKSPAADVTYNNVFVWAQYNVKLHESAAGTLSLTPTIRYRASGKDVVGSATVNNNQLRTELYATVTF